MAPVHFRYYQDFVGKWIYWNSVVLMAPRSCSKKLQAEPLLEKAKGTIFFFSCLQYLLRLFVRGAWDGNHIHYCTKPRVHLQVLSKNLTCGNIKTLLIILKFAAKRQDTRSKAQYKVL